MNFESAALLRRAVEVSSVEGVAVAGDDVLVAVEPSGPVGRKTLVMGVTPGRVAPATSAGGPVREICRIDVGIPLPLGRTAKPFDHPTPPSS
jgi:hypothetical protein